MWIHLILNRLFVNIIKIENHIASITYHYLTKYHPFLKNIMDQPMVYLVIHQCSAQTILGIFTEKGKAVRFIHQQIKSARELIAQQRQYPYIEGNFFIKTIPLDQEAPLPKIRAQHLHWDIDYPIDRIELPGPKAAR